MAPGWTRGLLEYQLTCRYYTTPHMQSQCQEASEARQDTWRYHPIREGPEVSRLPMASALKPARIPPPPGATVGSIDTEQGYAPYCGGALASALYITKLARFLSGLNLCSANLNLCDPKSSLCHAKWHALWRSVM